VSLFRLIYYIQHIIMIVLYIYDIYIKSCQQLEIVYESQKKNIFNYDLSTVIAHRFNNDFLTIVTAKI